MRKTFHYGVTRPLAWLLFFLTLCVFNAPPAGAFRRLRDGDKRTRTQALSPEQKSRREREERARRNAPRPDVEALPYARWADVRVQGPRRNAGFNGVLPWQRSFHDVNLCNGNLFKSFTDIQVKPARGAGLAFQRTYNSNDERVGPFGVGWTHAYEIRIEEAGNNEVPRTDFFGGKHTYHRDADGLYSPPAYIFDELASEYDHFLANGPAEVLGDTQKGMDGTIKHFAANGNARTCDYIEDRHGNRTELTYGLSVGTTSLLTRVTDQSGRYLEITWDNLGTQMQPAYRIVEVAGPYDANTSQPVYRVTYEYNGSFNLWKVHQDPAGLNRVTTYTYTTEQGEAGLLASVSDPLNHTVSYGYSIPYGDPTGTLWVTQITEPASGGPLVWSIDMGFDNVNHVVALVSCNAGPSTLMSELMVCSDTSLRWKRMGVMGIDEPIVTYMCWYDTQNNVVQKNTVRQDPQAPPPNLAPFGAFGEIAVATYGPHGNVLTEGFSILHNGSPTTIYATQTSYYAASKYFQKESVTDANGNTTHFDYFANDDPNAGNRGEVKWVRDARYGITGEQFEYTYNSYGQKLTETNLNNVVTEYAYEDAWGNLTEVVQDPGGTGHLNRTTEMELDIAGRVIASTDPKTQISTFQYNAVGQPTVATLPGETISYTYGGNGRTESVTDGRGTTTLTYETGNDRVASVADPVTGAMGYTYGLRGERTGVQLPGGGTWTYTYDPGWVVPTDVPDKATPMLLKVTDDQGREVQYHLDTTGQLREVISNVSFLSGSPTTYQSTQYFYQDPRSLLTRVRNAWHHQDPMLGWQEQVLIQNDYTYDDAGNRLTNTLSDDTGPIRTEEYGYDALARLTSVDYGDGQTQTYTFDPMGNRTQKADSDSGTENYTYNAANMLLTRGAGSYTNDANGNTLTGGGRTNTWDDQNRLTQCVYGGNTTTHTYGSDGLRRRTVQGMNTTDYVLDGSSVVRTYLNSSVDRTYLHGARGPEYERIGSNDPKWYLYDGLGSVLGTVDENGTVVSTRKYDVYGAVRGSTGPGGTKHKFVGGLGHPSEDETGLVYMRARYYDPVTGRFASEDPAKDGDNWYAYASCSPASRVDLDGKADMPGASIADLWMQFGLYFLIFATAANVKAREEYADAWIEKANSFAATDPLKRSNAQAEYTKHMLNAKSCVTGCVFLLVLAGACFAMAWLHEDSDWL